MITQPITFTCNGKIAQVPSDTREGLVHTVDLANNSCGCEAQRFRRTTCRHLKAARAAAQQPEQDPVTSLLNEAKGLDEAELTALIGRLLDEATERKEDAAMGAARDQWEALEALLYDTVLVETSSNFAEQDVRLRAIFA